MKRPSVRAAMVTAAFLVPLLGLAVINLFAGKAEISAVEQRKLRPMPVLSLQRIKSGAFFREFEEFFGDHFVFRDRFVQVARSITAWRRLPGDEQAQLMVVRAEAGFMDPAAKGGEQAEGDEAKTWADSSASMLVTKDRAMTIYRFHPERARAYADLLNRAYRMLPEGTRLYSLLVPTQIEFHTPAKYRGLSSSQAETIQYVNYRLNRSIIKVDGYGRMRAHLDEYLYFRTDHHWTALGAYYAYQAFMEQTGGEAALPLDRFRVERVEGFLGTGYSRTLSKDLEQRPDTVFIYRPPVTASYQILSPGQPVQELEMFNMNWAVGQHKYGIFLSGDVPLGKVASSVKNGRRIAVVKDSFANAFIPYLAAHYETIYIIDPREFKQPFVEFIKQEQISEVLFMNYVQVTNKEDFIGLMRQMIER